MAPFEVRMCTGVVVTSRARRSVHAAVVNHQCYEYDVDASYFIWLGLFPVASADGAGVVHARPAAVCKV